MCYDAFFSDVILRLIFSDGIPFAEIEKAIHSDTCPKSSSQRTFRL
jgi:hypothetical protein